MINNWQKISEEEVKVGFRTLLKRQFKLPDGRVEEYTIKKEGPTVCVLPLTKDNKVVLAKQFRPGPEKVLLELPGGNSDPGEGQQAAVERELLEETGYKGKLQFIGKSLDDAYSTQIRYNYVATDCEKVQEPLSDENEFIEVVEVPIDQFRDLMRKAEFTDVETAYLALDYLRRL